ncbi:class I SAM-dependent methyltransferase [Nonomuraea diastatica]|uniref:Methyltransferase domain-containing protein n=1 Tax=Nonomuraea diastatica TaxID=1848329 RepID=A0A4R4WR54_9ACTN|nr:class I SAM-dependent methyltransferase [Nonomuraea diastatica]TDD20283.1 methyltransferase domain-containing protein [Nonomuraea diastatica]
MTLSHTTEVIEYFRRKADGYDRVDEQVYWRLSDELLWEAMSRYVIPHIPDKAVLLDAGGGTGRWTDRMLRHRPDMSALLFDLSEHMTRHAEAKAERGGYGERLSIVNGDLADLVEKAGDRKFDIAISFHNVLGFVRDVRSVLQQIAAVLNPGGQLVLVLPNRYHAVFFNLLTGSVSEAESAAFDRRGRFTSDMPAMHLFTPAELVGALNESGLPVAISTGFPVAVYPGFQETQIAGTSGLVSDVFADQSAYDRIKAIEFRLLGEPGLAERGNNLFVVARKPPESPARS